MTAINSQHAGESEFTFSPAIWHEFLSEHWDTKPWFAKDLIGRDFDPDRSANEFAHLRRRRESPSPGDKLVQ